MSTPTSKAATARSGEEAAATSGADSADTDTHGQPFWRRGLPRVDLPEPNPAVVRLREAVRRRYWRIARGAAGSLILAVGLVGFVALVANPGQAETAAGEWWARLAATTPFAPLTPSSTAWTVAGVVTTLFVALALGRVSLGPGADVEATGRVVVLDGVLASFAAAGAVLCWLLVLAPASGGDPRSFDVVGPVLAALLCSFLGGLSDPSSESEEYRRRNSEDLRRRLLAAERDYARHLERSPVRPASGRAAVAQGFAAFRLWPAVGVTAVFVALDVLLVAIQVPLDHVHVVAAASLGVAALLLGFFWLEASAESHVTRVGSGRGGWGLAPFPCWFLTLAAVVIGAARLALGDWWLGSLLLTCALAPLASWVLTLLSSRTRRRYLCLVHDKLARRLAAIAPPTPRKRRRLPPIPPTPRKPRRPPPHPPTPRKLREPSRYNPAA